MTQLDATLAETHHSLGCAGTETNDPASALKHFQAFTDLVVSKPSEVEPEDIKVSIAWNELGNAWMLNKSWFQGEECFQRSIKAAKARADFDPTDISFPMVNLGLAFWFTGRLEEASAVLQEGLGHREAKFGKDDKTSFMYVLSNFCLLDSAYKLM